MSPEFLADGKYALIEHLLAELRDNEHGIRCAGTFAEIITFKLDENREFGAEEGFHDDRVMSFLHDSEGGEEEAPLPNAQAQLQEDFFRTQDSNPAAVSVNAW